MYSGWKQVAVEELSPGAPPLSSLLPTLSTLLSGGPQGCYKPGSQPMWLGSTSKLVLRGTEILGFQVKPGSNSSSVTDQHDPGWGEIPLSCSTSVSSFVT